MGSHTDKKVIEQKKDSVTKKSDLYVKNQPRKSCFPLNKPERRTDGK